MSRSRQDIFNCHKISEGAAAGEALVSAHDLNFYMVDPETGNVLEKGHSLEGKSIAGKTLVFPGGKGSSVVQADGLYQLAMKNKAPHAMIIRNPDTVLVASAIIMNIPMVDKADPAFYEEIKDGHYVEVDATQGRIIVVKDK